MNEHVEPCFPTNIPACALPDAPPRAASRLLAVAPARPAALTANSLLLIGSAAVLGIAADCLHLTGPLGLNAGLWTALLLAAALLLALRSGERLTAAGRGLLGAALLFSACLAWRDSPLLAGLNLALTALCLLLAAAHSRSLPLWPAGLADYAARALQSAWNAALGAFPLLRRDIRWSEMREASSSSQASAVVRGLLLALPFLLLFGALFASADAGFERIVHSVLDWLPLLSPGRLVWMFVVAWITSGFLRQFLFGRPADSPDRPVPAFLSLGLTEANVALLCLNLLFAGFVATQIPYFFGGSRLVTATAGLTLAEYVRRGFFELVTVAALVLPLLLAADWIVRKTSPAGIRLFRALCACLTGLLFVIMGSAVQRMILYVQSYGLTELRLYVTAFMLLLALVFVWFLLTVLRDRRGSFAAGALALGLTAALAVQALNPDALIARTNLDRAASGKPTDFQYLASLGDEALPHLAAALPRLKPEDREILSPLVLQRMTNRPPADWRSWNWGRFTARRALEGPRAEPAVR